MHADAPGTCRAPPDDPARAGPEHAPGWFGLYHGRAARAATIADLVGARGLGVVGIDESRQALGASCARDLYLTTADRLAPVQAVEDIVRLAFDQDAIVTEAGHAAEPLEALGGMAAGLRSRLLQWYVARVTDRISVAGRPARVFEAELGTSDTATRGRRLFNDVRLSGNDRVSCASCHIQQFGFSDTAQISRGFQGGLTGRHSMGLSNARYYQRGRFFWDERAATLEDQVLQPIQNTTEMGMTLADLKVKLAASAYYPGLFSTAFGSSAITDQRIALALAQFVRAMSSYQSKYDRALASGNPASVLSSDEEAGRLLFTGPAGCARCHVSDAQVMDLPHNDGLDAVTVDTGAGQGRFKSPSLRNVATRARFMRDGRFTSLAQVVGHYNTGIQPNADLDPRLRGPGGQPQRLGLSPAQVQQLVAFMNTLTDNAHLTAAKFKTPF